MRKTKIALALAATLGAGPLAWRAFAAQVIEVAQKGRAFAVREIEIARGGALHFTNEDDFPHQIYTKGPGVDIDSPLQSPGETITVVFPAAGLFEVRCAVHPRMRLGVRVQ